MDFAAAIERVRAVLEGHGHRFALIGGLAMSAYGMARTTFDLDLVVDAAAQDLLVRRLEELGYRTLHRSAGYSNHAHPDPAFGDVDCVYVRGETAEQLFAAVRPLPGPGGRPVAVPSPEHLAAMKVVAMKNDPSRVFQDLADIRHLMTAAGANRDEVRHQFVRHGLEERFDELAATL